MDNYYFDNLNQEEVASAFSSYFEYFTNLYGTSFLTGACRRAISKGHFDLKTLAVVDPAYEYTRKFFSEAARAEGLKIVAIKDNDGKSLGYFRIRFVTLDEVPLACVAEIVLPSNTNVDRINALKEMIKSIEQNVITTYPDIEGLDFEVGSTDYEMQSALVELGFHLLIDSTTQDKITYMYEKPLRQRNATV